jgi:hypothetical protein
LRRLKITDDAFYEMFDHLHHIQHLDISNSPFIAKRGMLKFLESCTESVRGIQASNCQDAIDDEVLKAIANVESTNLEMIDISFAKMVTDEGLNAFEGKTFPFNHLCFTGCIGITGKGLFHPISCGKKTLIIFEGALLDQEEMKHADFGKALGQCFNLECLDLGGSTYITDEFFQHLSSGE